MQYNNKDQKKKQKFLKLHKTTIAKNKTKTKASEKVKLVAPPMIYPSTKLEADNQLTVLVVQKVFLANSIILVSVPCQLFACKSVNFCSTLVRG